MTVRISKKEMEAIANTCGGIKDGIEGTGNKIAALTRPELAGWQTVEAIAEVNRRWQEKANHSGGQWRYFGSSVTETAKQISGADKEIAFTFPKVGEGEMDIPVLDEYKPQPLPGPGDRGEQRSPQGR